MQYQCLSELGRVLGLVVPSSPISQFTFDSRTVAKGSVFFALQGHRSDGHDFLSEVGQKGAHAAIVEQNYAGQSYGMTLLRVPNVVMALQTLAKELQNQRKQKIIAITGSVGKTTTKDFIATLLAHKHTVTKTPRSCNSQVALPLALLNDPGTAEFFVVEMGMQKGGEIKKLVEIAPPDIAVITNVGRQHQAFFPITGIEGIAEAKSEILTHLKTSTAVIHADAMRYRCIAEKGQNTKITFGRFPLKGDFVLDDKENRIRWNNDLLPKMKLPFSESHFYENFLAAFAVVKALGLSFEEIALAATHLKTPELRFQKIEKYGALFINDCWNADPMSMKAALNNLPKPSLGRRVIGVLGHMAELGSYSEEGHREVALTALNIVDDLWCIGEKSQIMVDVFANAGKKAKMFADIHVLKKTLLSTVCPGDVILIKGSNGLQLWKILED